ncbi:hypothetical protein HOT89_gp04 [Vibrio phage vB_VpaP_KF1]|uniref:Uncharacterized protein n=1 Tax=Vibrio phage vB_VpaP_KF1 TaxID=2041472 RepID=A0A384X1X2_9CAUD|nr:hypothetical protein HOT89_gp04 [Vibrio phage vB_VpaP_KF1]ATI19027.1 hypothetical protein KF1_005 [Vibrio phage vB_VpaP_KF1]
MFHLVVLESVLVLALLVRDEHPVQTLCLGIAHNRTVHVMSDIVVREHVA